MTNTRAPLWPRSFELYRSFQEAVRSARKVFVLCEIEPTTRCNVSCSFCPRKALKRPAGDMTPQTAALIGDQLGRRPPKAVILSGFGEPTLNPALPDIAGALAERLPVPVGVTTNATLLERSLIESLLSAGVGFFHVSVAALDPGTARKVTPGVDPLQVEENLYTLISVCRGRVPVAANVVVTEGNRAHARDLCRRLKALGINSVYRTPAHSRGGALYRPDRPSLRQDCWVYRYTMFVDWRGFVLPCCHDLEGREILGDLRRHTPVQIDALKAERRVRILSSERCSFCDFFLASGRRPGPAGPEG